MYRSYQIQGYHQGGLPFPSSFVLGGLKPKISPTKPPGFGTGHSLFGIGIGARDNAMFSSLLFSTLWHSRDESDCSPSFPTHFLLRLLRCGVPSGISPSAYAKRGAGHGKTCGKATTKKLANSVVANREDVNRLRGWRCGGIVGISIPSHREVQWTNWHCRVLDTGGCNNW
jgi:hypothetical protein